MSGLKRKDHYREIPHHLGPEPSRHMATEPYYNRQRPCFALDYDTPRNYYERFKRGEIERKDTFSNRQLSDIPKFIRRAQEVKNAILTCPPKVVNY